MAEHTPYSGNLRTLDDINVERQAVLLRADLDVKADKPDGHLRLHALKDTVEYLIQHDASKIILIGHIGRPERRIKYMSTSRLVDPLRETLGTGLDFKVDFTKNPSSRVVVFDNLRFWEGEKANDPEFARELASMGTVYINDAFGNSHRDHASMSSLPRLMEQSAVGRQVEREVRELEGVLARPKDGFISLVGGAKVDTKMDVIDRLAEVSELVLIGGKMSEEIAQQGLKFPDNVAVATSDYGDISGAASGLFSYLIRNEARTILWNGPMGVLDPREMFAGIPTELATAEMADAVASSNAYTVVGGGDTSSYLNKHGLTKNYSFVSMGGGAMLDFIAGKPMPALEALRK